MKRIEFNWLNSDKLVQQCIVVNNDYSADQLPKHNNLTIKLSRQAAYINRFQLYLEKR